VTDKLYQITMHACLQRPYKNEKEKPAKGPGKAMMERKILQVPARSLNTLSRKEKFSYRLETERQLCISSHLTYFLSPCKK